MRCVDQVKLDKETEQDAAHPAAGHRSSRIDFVVHTYPSVSTEHTRGLLALQYVSKFSMVNSLVLSNGKNFFQQTKTS